ncbi:MAG: lactate permease LctP family transporter [Acidobacteria bacterium]|nr:lactate permease LctP family transporter [Acidobacteriota bacterium]
MEWVQLYDPLGQAWLSTAAAALPIVLLLVTLGVLEWPAHRAALTGLVSALAVSIAVYGMPVGAATATAAYGAAYGLFPIGWIILNAVFLYNLTVRTGQFQIVKDSVAHLSADRRIQALLIAFSFGAFIEGAAGFGTPVAISAALLMGLGFAPLYAAGLALIANTAPVAYGAIGTPIITLAAVTGIPAETLSAMAGRQLPFVSLLVPAWLVVTLSGWSGLAGVWPAVLVAGGSFAVVQFLWSNYIGPELVDIMGGLVSLVSLAIFCRRWKPHEAWRFSSDEPSDGTPHLAAVATRDTTSTPLAAHVPYTRAQMARAWMPWVFLSVFVTLWGLTVTKALLNGGFAGLATYRATGRPAAASLVLSPTFDMPGLHRRVYRDYPVEAQPVDRARVSDPAYKAARAEAARFTFNWLSATGTGIFFAALLSAIYLRLGVGEFSSVWFATWMRMRRALATIALMLALGFVTRYGGSDATLGLAFTHTGVLYPFFAALLGWLGVALTGSDTSSNVLFGSLQKITAQQLGLDPVLITTANSTGGVMGKMIDAQSIVVATASTAQQGQEGRILRFVFWHSIALACIMGIIVLLQAYVCPWMIPR